MPQVDRVDEIVDELCDLFGLYGSCGSLGDGLECGNDPRKMCRVCFTDHFADRFRRAVENEKKLKAAGL